MFEKTSNMYVGALIGILAFFPSMMPSVLSVWSSKTDSKTRDIVKMENKVFMVPLFYGFINAIVFYLINKHFPDNLKNFWVVGFMLAFFYPTLGTIGDYAKKVYGVKSYKRLYFGAQVMYLAYYGIFVPWFLRKLYNL
jgi:predicted permease